MGRRKTLSDKFHEICPNVYFQPPESINLRYPCIIYSLNTITADYADNRPYILGSKYSVLYITRKADDPNVMKIALLPTCRAERFYTSDNLYHYPYTISDYEE